MQKYILEKLYEGKKLNYEESKKLFYFIIKKKLSTEQISAILISMKIRGENVDEIYAAVNVMMNEIKYFPRPNYLFADVVGTGGDIKNSINISTTSAIVAAGCGARIAKHNNKSFSSVSGSADILEFFGINLYHSPEQSKKHLDEYNLCFLFAPHYNNGFNINVNKVRKILKTRTIFNIIGPLLNPAKPDLALIGVYSPKLLLPMVNSVKKLNYKRAIIVHSDGMDEVTLHANTHVAELRNNKIYSYSLSAEDFGLKHQLSQSLIIRSIEENYEIISNILQGKGHINHKNVIAANVSLILRLFGYENLKKNTCLALDEINSGFSYKRIMSLVQEDKYGK